MKTNWKTRLKTVLAKKQFSGVSTNSALSKADKSHLSLVSSVIDSGQLVDTPENFIEKEIISPFCSNCNLEMELTENGNLWFCPFGCESRAANETR